MGSRLQKGSGVSLKDCSHCMDQDVFNCGLPHSEGLHLVVGESSVEISIKFLCARPFIYVHTGHFLTNMIYLQIVGIF